MEVFIVIVDEIRRTLCGEEDVLVDRVEVGRWHRTDAVVLLVPLAFPYNDANRLRRQAELQTLILTEHPDPSAVPPVECPPTLPFPDDTLDRGLEEPSANWRASPTLPAVRTHLAAGLARQLLAAHTNVCAVFAGPKMVDYLWTDTAAVLVVVRTKGFIPVGERPFSEAFPGVPIDVIEGDAQLYPAEGSPSTTFPRRGRWRPG